MIKRILVPLDGRESSEAVLPVVNALAREGAVVRLVRVFPQPERIVGDHGRTIAYVDQEIDRLTGAGMAELRPIESQLAEIPVEKVVRFGAPAPEILVEAEAFGADVVVLSTEARGWIRRALTSSVADRVARRSPVPTLVLQRPSPD
jgi:nucleotide-binding universal stress UspA family protein